MATKIILQCIDKTLEPVSLPKLTSGGKKDIVLEIQFDESWNGYGGRVATFWRDKNLVHHATLVSDACEVSWSDVFEPGVLTVAVFGVSGGVVKTSEAIDLTIEQGAITGASSVEPIPSIYQQLLNAYGKASAAQAVESARLDQVLAGVTADGSEAADIRVSAEGLTYAAAGEAVRNQAARSRSLAANLSLYDMDVVKQHMGIKNLCGVETIVGQITDASHTWQYVAKEIPLPVGVYTVVVRDMHIPEGGYFTVAAGVSQGRKYLQITEPGVYVTKVYDDLEVYNPAAVVLKLQMAQSAGVPVGVYHVGGIAIYEGDVTALPALPEALTGADKKVSKQIGKNLFDKDAPDIVMGRYLSELGGLMEDEYSTKYYATGFIPIKAETTYALTDHKIGGAAIVFYDADRTVISAMIGNNGLIPVGGIFTTPAGAAFVRLTGFIENIDANQLEEGDKITAFEPYTEYAPAGDNKRRLDLVDKRLNAPAVEKVERSALVSGESMTLASPNTKNHNVINFSAKVQSFSALTVSHGKTEPYCSAYVVIDATHVHVYAYPGTESKLATYAHGLTISEHIAVSLHTEGGFSAKLKVATASGVFAEVIDWDGSRGDIMVESQGSALTDCVLTYYLEGLRRNVWLFGDSYFNYWPKQMVEWGYGDYYLDGFSGRGSATALESLKKCLAYAVPEKLVWCMGMNDSDANWTAALTTVQRICAQYDIELILATVPNVPEHDHTAKNAAVRSSGHRYVDFCGAVGADVSVNWHTGLQSGDGVHPTQKGAVALAMRAMRDVPELLQ